MCDKKRPIKEGRGEKPDTQKPDINLEKAARGEKPDTPKPEDKEK